MRRIVVVGGLAAGPAAAAQAARDDARAEVTLVEAGPHIAYGVCELPNFIGGEISEASPLVPFTPQRFEREKRVRVFTAHRAEAIDVRARRVQVRDDRGREVEFPYDALVLAVGSTPRRPPGGNPRPLKSVADAQAIRAEADRCPGGHAAVLGAGYIGLLAADALRSRGLQVTVFDRHPLPLSDLEPEGSQWVAEALAAASVELHGGTDVKTGVVEGADVVVAALGGDPETALARAAGIEIGASGGIRTDERGETSAASVFAAGDCAEVRHAVSGRPALVPLATVAGRNGHAVGGNAAGGSVRLAPAVGALAFRAFGLEIGRVGLSSREAEQCGLAPIVVSVRSQSRVAVLPGARPLWVALIVERATGRLLGGNVIGPEGAALRLNILAALVARGATAAELARLDLAYAPSFSPLRDPLLVAAARAERDRR